MIAEKSKEAVRVRRPFFLTLLCLIGFTYTSLFSLLFLLGMLYSTGISGILNKYLQLYDLSRLNFLLFSLGGFFVFFSSFMGILLMWRLQRLGLYIYAISVIVFMITELILTGIFLPDIILHSLLIILFIVAFPLQQRKRRRT
ncbi:MAG: hypothetical protein HQ565_11230 [Bacteroidetes bacterium]|nr:hypothetical protein [Bacteroidota bacterium]